MEAGLNSPTQSGQMAYESAHQANQPANLAAYKKFILDPSNDNKDALVEQFAKSEAAANDRLKKFLEDLEKDDPCAEDAIPNNRKVSSPFDGMTEEEIEKYLTDGNNTQFNIYMNGFTKKAENHPGTSSVTTPNWFYYLKDGNVCGIPSTAIYDPTASFGYTLPGVDNILRLGPLASDENTGPETFTSPTYGSVKVTGDGKGVDCVAETAAHELHHLTLYNRSLGKIDSDGDEISDSDEPTLDGVNSNKNNPDTYFLGKYNSSYFSYGDNEIRCRKKELNPTNKANHSLDWANPGKQSKNKF